MTSKQRLLPPHFIRTLLTIALPIILQNLMQSLVNMLDTIMVGRLGAVAIAAVGLGNQIFFLLALNSSFDSRIRFQSTFQDVG